ncbi:two-component system response regulator AdeR [Sphingobium sp. B11D3B]|uniref:response regulator transcription factor n=1 Tax=unclassified Sphingobium TaxID=2611147 RepID=UPI0022249861|nr:MULTISPECIES: response regulator transcription factor [unclassified Sphingobium]MCW2387707.1 two-component system response regulator AdeR [Sphingobium sp. B11D3B]MCW2394240.1 two-component system response regulator AdeR [Sphingobium sp. B8D3B]MCW2417754.1 two-component system response regulator AdeR [Sphingobium sp. B8D3C]
MDAENALVLVAEDEPEIADVIAAYLEREGFRTVRAADGRTALELHLALKPDLVMLDVQMPRLNGWDVLAELRRRGSTPVIMLTALDQDIDKLQALRIGADDYVVKPFNALEVAARARAVLRRSGGSRGSTLRVGPIEIDMDSHLASVIIGDDPQRVSLSLTLTEFRILAHMARAPRRAFSRGELVDACLPGGDALDRTVDTHLSKLRRKLEDAGAHGFINNVRGVGFRLADIS